VNVTSNILRNVAILVLRAGLVCSLAGAGWVIFKRFPAATTAADDGSDLTTVQIQILQAPDVQLSNLEVVVDLYPVDIVAVRHEYFMEPRAGKRLEDFLKERMKGRSPVSARLDKQGRGSVVLPPGNWWLHAKISGDEDLEWRLPVSVVGHKQIVELTPQNAYTRSKTF
jgi:hypothetical protein